jgi:hypothetical protein
MPPKRLPPKEGRKFGGRYWRLETQTGQPRGDKQNHPVKRNIDTTPPL